MLLLLSLFACSTETGCTDLAAYSTSVSVVDASGDPIAAATGTYTVDGGASKPCESWSPGQLVCGIEEAGHFVIEVSAEGYVAGSTGVDVGADECHVIGEVLEVALESVECTEQAVPSAHVSVRAEDGSPLVDSVVTYAANGGEVSTCTASGDGTHWCGSEEAGELRIEATAFGFQSASAVVEVAADECHVLTEEVTMTLSPNECGDMHVPAVIVNLSDSGGAELANPAVTYAQDGSDALIPCSDHGAGVWWCGNTVGEYVISATADGHAPASATASVLSDTEGCYPVTWTVDLALEWLPD